MKSKKWYAKRVLDIPIWGLVIGAFIYIGGTYLKNLLEYGKANVLATMVIGGGVVLICLLMAYAVRLCFHRVYRRKGIATLMAVVGGFPLVALALVYGLLPLFGVELQKEGVPFSWGQFMAKTFNAFFSVTLITAGYTFFYGRLLSERRGHELEQVATNRAKEWVEVQNQQLLNAAQSHYVRYVMNDVVARAAIAGDDYTAAQVSHIGRTFNYVADVTQQGTPVVFIHLALDYFDEVVASIRRRHGDDGRAVAVQVEGEPTMQVIGALTLTTLLENSDTHGWVDASHPIMVRFVFSRGRLQFTCTNAKYPYPRRVESTGKGLGLVAGELALLDRHDVEFDVHENEEFYTVSLIINYS